MDEVFKEEYNMKINMYRKNKNKLAKKGKS